MSTKTHLRDYQQQAIADIEVRRTGGAGCVPLVLATGLGKTQIFTSYADHWLSLAENAGERVLIIAHTDELIGQAAKRQRQVAPARRVGIVKASQNEILAEIIVSSVQTLRVASRRAQIKRVGLIIIDECHHAHAKNTYGKILEHFGALESNDGTSPNSDGVRNSRSAPPFVLGVTATLARSDKAKLSSVWEDCTFTRDILFGIRNGYLLDVRGERIIVPDLDMSNVRVRAGDFSDTDIADELERTFAPELIAREYARLASLVPVGYENDWTPEDVLPMRRGIAFWPLVETAYHGAKAFEDVGIRSGVVHGQLPKPERRELLQRFSLPLTHDEAIDVMHNAMVLTEGFDEPTADVVVIARPTRSAPLFQQMVGRVLRPDLTKPPAERGKALILDVTGAGEQNNLRSLIDLSPERPKPTDADAELDGRSLLEWDEYLDEIEAELDDKRAGATTYFDSDTYTGPVETKSFDPLGRSAVWGQTPAGHYYINAGAGYVFLAPSLAEDAEPGTWDVVTCSTRAVDWTDKNRVHHKAFIEGTEHRGLELEMALGWGEDVAIELGGHGAKTLTGRKSAWRRAEPKPGALAEAARLRIEVTPGMTGGELSELIDAKHSARRIDPLVTRATALASARGNS